MEWEPFLHVLHIRESSKRIRTTSLCFVWYKLYSNKIWSTEIANVDSFLFTMII